MTKCIELPESHTKFCLTLPNEQIVLSKREHPFILALRLFGVALIGVSLIIVGAITHTLFDSLPLLVAYVLIVLALIRNLVLKTAIDWYYHIYIVTNRKLLEIRCKPFFSDKIDNVFLDQVRTTEIDSSIPTVIHEFLNMGNVVIGFDRPSHEEAFTLTNIKQPGETASFMSDILENIMRRGNVWFEPEKSTEVIKFTEDIYQSRFGAN